MRVSGAQSASRHSAAFMELLSALLSFSFWIFSFLFYFVFLFFCFSFVLVFVNEIHTAAHVAQGVNVERLIE